MQGDVHVYHLKVDPSGRIVLPSEIRARHHITDGDVIVATEDETGLHIKTQRQTLAEAQAYFSALAPSNILLSEEILNDRRREAAHE